MSEYIYTTQAQVRTAFKQEYPDLNYKKIPHYSGVGLMYQTDVRVEFINFIDYLVTSKLISEKLASKVTLK